MPKYVFQLDALLRHRKHLEQERQRDLAVVQGKMSRVQDELNQMNETLAVAMRDLRENRLVGRVDVHFLAAHRRYILATQRKAHAIAQEMAQIQREVDEARTALTQAARDHKMVDKLREKHKARWDADQARREFAELDEIGMRLAVNRETGSDSGFAGDGAHDGEIVS